MIRNKICSYNCGEDKRLYSRVFPSNRELPLHEIMFFTNFVCFQEKLKSGIYRNVSAENISSLIRDNKEIYAAFVEKVNEVVEKKTNTENNQKKTKFEILDI